MEVVLAQERSRVLLAEEQGMYRDSLQTEWRLLHAPSAMEAGACGAISVAGGDRLISAVYLALLRQRGLSVH